jgi:hypothetical protein
MGDTQPKKKKFIPFRKRKGGGVGNKAKQKKTSAWHITVNANKKTGQFDGGEAELKRRLTVCARLLEDPHLKKFVYIMRKEDTYEANVLSHTSEHAIEKGPRGFWHVHCLIRIKHNTSCRLSYPIFKSACSKILGVPCHMHAQLVPKSQQQPLADIRAYIKKDQPSSIAEGKE